MGVQIIRIQYNADSSQGLPAVLEQLRKIREINLVQSTDPSDPRVQPDNLIKQLQSVSTILLEAGYAREAETLQDVCSLSALETDFGGLGFTTDSPLSKDHETSVLFLVSAYLESLNSADRSKKLPTPLPTRPPGRRGMTLSEKIFAAHDIEARGFLRPGDMVRVDVDWIMASELSWGAMSHEYDALGKPGIFRNDRFWLAGDHVVDPRIKDTPKVKQLVATSERAKREFSMTDYQGMNYTIMHTEFCRERAQPGMMVIGSDSHTCSGGSVGCLAIGLGVSDVTMPLITGETWFKVPESVNIRLINAPAPGIGGKDTILYIMKELKRNTVAADRVIEFTGPGLKHLSCDARFAIANMTTEFGGITGVFVPDEITQAFINRRKTPRHKKNAMYFRPDEDAQYASTHIIDLSQVESFVAKYPKPDDVVPVSQIEGTHLDGCFIGACTTAEEDLVIGAMVLEIGFKKGLVPVKEGKRRVVPGSLPILNKLKATGLADVYEKAGFTIGVPGCSYCVGMGADKAGAGEVWLSSQNRNFENRMGTGSIGNLSSAATVAASSLAMKVTDPKSFLEEIDQARLQDILGYGTKKRIQQSRPLSPPVYVEPYGPSSRIFDNLSNEVESMYPSSDNQFSSGQPTVPNESSKPLATHETRRGKIQRLGDFIDTDALAPADSLTTCQTNQEFGEYCLKYTHPSFRERAKDGYSIVVAGSAFGCGSSRENAVSALLGTGIICVIAKSFAFIYGRNQPNLGMLGITVTDDSFYEAAGDGKECIIDLTGLTVGVEGCEQKWHFKLSPMEKKLAEVGGITSAFQKFGKDLFNVLCASTKRVTKVSSKGLGKSDSTCGDVEELQW